MLARDPRKYYLKVVEQCLGIDRCCAILVKYLNWCVASRSHMGAHKRYHSIIRGKVETLHNVYRE